MGIIQKVNESRNWIHNGTLRLCLDPMDLKKFIKRQRYLIHTLEKIFAGLNVMRNFSVLDLKDGFWQIALDHDS